MQKILLSLFLLFISLTVFAEKGTDIVKFTNPESVRYADGTFSISIHAKIKTGWNLYSAFIADGGPIPTTFSFPALPIENFKVTESNPIKKFDQNFNMETSWFTDSASFKITGKFTSTENPENISVRFMVCVATYCLPPVRFQIPLQWKNGKTLSPFVKKATPDLTSEAQLELTPKTQPIVIDENQTQTKNAPILAGDTTEELPLMAFIWLAISIGALTLLTPCVFPMIPITVSYFTQRQESGQAKPIKDAAIYMAGIIGTFTILGFLLALLFGAAGINQFATNPWINLFVAGLFIFFALNLFGLFELSLPYQLQTKLTTLSGNSGWIGILLMALTFTITSFTCTMPFVGTILVSATRGEWFYPIMGMLSFSAVIALPFFLLAIFPGWIAKLPKSGNWMLSVKIVMGFLELAAAFKFLSNADLVWQLELLTRERFLIAWASLMGITALYLLGVFSFSHETNNGKSLHPIRILFASFFLYLAIDFGTASNGRPLGELEAFLPPSNYGKTRLINIQSSSQKLVWRTNLELAKIEAQQTGKKIFIDFTGYTCTNCRWMEQNMFVIPEIENLLAQFILVKLYTDGDGVEYEKNQTYQEKKFGSVALPMYVVLTSDEQIIGRFEGMTRSVKTYSDFLQKTLEN